MSTRRTSCKGRDIRIGEEERKATITIDEAFVADFHPGSAPVWRCAGSFDSPDPEELAGHLIHCRQILADTGTGPSGDNGTRPFEESPADKIPPVWRLRDGLPGIEHEHILDEIDSHWHAYRPSRTLARQSGYRRSRILGVRLPASYLVVNLVRDCCRTLASASGWTFTSRSGSSRRSPGTATVTTSGRMLIMGRRM